MLEITVRGAGAATSYYTHMIGEAASNSPSKEDYYSREGAGYWSGAAAEKFGVSGAVDAKEFALLCNGFSAAGEALVQRAGDPDRRAGWDCTFSAPKSVSLVWANGDPATAAAVEKAHAHAVETALQFMQDRAAETRRGQDGLRVEKGALCIANFQHGTSRELDPQLHTHSFIINAALRQDSTTGTLDGKPMMDWKMATGALYRAELSSQMRRLGFEVERDGDSFRLSSVSKEAEREFSKRAAQIREYKSEHGMETYKQAKTAALATRKTKDHDIDPVKLREQWLEAGMAFGLDKIERHADVKSLDKVDVSQVLDEAHQNKSVSREQDILASAFRASQGVSGAAGAREYGAESIAQAVHLGAGKDGKDRFSTRGIVAAEQRIIQVAQGFDKQAHPLPMRERQESGPALSAEQQQAREYMAQAGSLKVLIGDAGTGKSTMLRQVAIDHQAAGYQVLGCSTSGKAAAGLQESAGIQSQTIASLLREIDQGQGPLHSKSMLVIDEAGMVDSRNMARLLDSAEKAGAKVALVGDHKQLQPVGSGAVFAKMAESHGDPARLQEIHRQREDWAKQAVTAMSKGDAAQAMGQYIERGAVSIEKTHRDAVQAVAEKIISARQELTSQALKTEHKDMAPVLAAKEVLGIASTNQAVNDINKSVREALTKSGKIPDAREVSTATGKLEIGGGDRLLITKNDRQTGLKNGDLCTVLRWDKERPNCVQVRLDRDPQHITVLAPEDLHMRHGFAVTTYKAQGATVEKAVILGSEHTSREVAYVQSSRARDETQWVFSHAKVEKIAETVPPTEKMREYAQALEAQRLERGEKPALSPEHTESFKSCRQFLDKHSDRTLGQQPPSGKLAELKDILQAMSKSQQKESTLDYQPAPIKDKAAEQGGPDLEI